MQIIDVYVLSFPLGDLGTYGNLKFTKEHLNTILAICPTIPDQISLSLPVTPHQAP